MLPKLSRLEKGDFKLLKKSKKKVFSSENFNLALYKKKSDQSRFGVVVSASVEKRAVNRNKLKRRIRSVFLRLLGAFKKDFFAVVYAKKGSSSLNFNEIENQIESLFKKSGILKND